MARQFHFCDKSLCPRASRAGMLISGNEAAPVRPSRQEPGPVMRQLPHVALLIETSRGYGRSLLHGVIRYQREHRPWSIYFQPQALGAPPPSWLKNWHGDGILARIEDRAMARAIRRTGLPALDLRFSVPRLGLPGVGIDNRAVVRLAFEHLANSGLVHFGFCGPPPRRNTWMDLRRDHFRQLVENAGHACHVFEPASGSAPASW